MSSPLITARSLAKSFGSQTLFDDISFGLFEGDKVGLIGPNGSGKSTLLKILASLESPDNGEVIRRKYLTVGYVAQSSFAPDDSVEEGLKKFLQSESSMEEYMVDTKVAIMLSQTGFSDPSLPVNRLSGGWRKRFEIAKQLLLEPDLVLFDEPTNHLDLEGILWLEQLLQRASFTYLVTSHDRTFLERATKRVMELNRAFPKGLFIADGAYNSFLEKREQFLLGQIEEQASLSSKVRYEQEWLKQNPKARTTKSVARIQQAGELIAELDDLQRRNRTNKVNIEFNATERLTRKLVTLKNVSKSIGSKSLIRGLDLTLSPGSRIGILGANGTGKTTLLRLVAGELEADLGTIKRAEGLKIVYFDQHRAEVASNITLKEALAPHSEFVNYHGRSIHVNSWAQSFLFPKEKLVLPISQLSGGEKARVLIARLMLEPADVLLLDEPTNDLDIPTLEILETSLMEFPGAIVLISHDRRFMDNVCQGIVGLGGQDQTQLFADQKQWLDSKPFATVDSPAKGSKDTRVTPVKSVEKKLSFKDIHELRTIEEQIASTEKDISSLTTALERETIPEAMEKKCQALNLAQAELDRLLKRWEELEAKKL